MSGRGAFLVVVVCLPLSFVLIAEDTSMWVTAPLSFVAGFFIPTVWRALK